MTTDDVGELRSADVEAAVDTEVVRRAREIAARLSLSRPTHGRTELRGAGLLRSVRYSGSSDEIDIEATLDRLVESARMSDRDIIVRERRQNRRSIVLAVDVSGSMSGERAQTAAATIGATVGRLSDDAVGVLAFWSDASVLVPLGDPSSPEVVLDLLLQLPSRGLTNIEFPLRAALSQLERVPARDARVLLLSDCVHNAGPDPRSVASRLPRLDVLLDTSGEHDVDLARDLAELGRGRFASAATYRDVAPAMSRLFGP
ncbi:vWA domain-containing protein [Nocardioides humi]|uniref:VWFA domain-containing protein n=1 Tax=Nocardioides humi TaxID=449461 RepID=A0ABN2BZZ3_9ACTN|nr:vWA domain-containing protein [Nocardioides humi]